MILAICIVVAAAAVIFYAGPKLSVVAERVAGRLGVQDAVGGAVFLGLATSLSGTVVSVSAALRGDASLALSNGLGGIAAQTAFLAVADCFHRRANLEHDSASVANLFQIGLLGLLLSMLLMAFNGPPVTLWGVHPVSMLLPVVWVAGTILADRAGKSNPWRAARKHADDPPAEGDGDAESEAGGGSDAEAEIGEDVDQNGGGDDDGPGWFGLLWRFAALGGMVAVAGYFLSKHVPTLTDEIGLTRSAAGFLFTATATSLPELVTTVAAVRRGALTFAVGNIVGGNAFDTLFCTVADAAYRDGSIYHASTSREQFVASLGLVMTSLLLLGLIGRERRGLARIGTESVLMLVTYAAGAVLLTLMRDGS